MFESKTGIRSVGVIFLLMRTRSILPCTQNGHRIVPIAKTYGRIMSTFIRHVRPQIMR